jgi:hypothetical protein
LISGSACMVNGYLFVNQKISSTILVLTVLPHCRKILFLTYLIALILPICVLYLAGLTGNYNQYGWWLASIVIFFAGVDQLFGNEWIYPTNDQIKHDGNSIYYFFFGLPGLIFFIGQGLIALTTYHLITYIQHYGLKRRKMDDGRYEKFSASHTWNCNFLISNFWRTGHLMKMRWTFYGKFTSKRIFTSSLNIHRNSSALQAVNMLGLPASR